MKPLLNPPTPTAELPDLIEVPFPSDARGTIPNFMVSAKKLGESSEGIAIITGHAKRILDALSHSPEDIYTRIRILWTQAESIRELEPKAARAIHERTVDELIANSIGEHPEAFHLQMEIFRSYLLILKTERDWPQLLSRFEKFKEIANQYRLPTLKHLHLGRLCVAAYTLCTHSGRYRAADRFFDEAIEHLVHARDDHKDHVNLPINDLLAKEFGRLANPKYFAGQHAESYRCLTEALEIKPVSDDHRLSLYLQLTATSYALGYPKCAGRWMEEASKLLPEKRTNKQNLQLFEALRQQGLHSGREEEAWLMTKFTVEEMKTMGKKLTDIQRIRILSQYARGCGTQNRDQLENLFKEMGALIADPKKPLGRVNKLLTNVLIFEAGAATQVDLDSAIQLYKLPLGVANELKEKDSWPAVWVRLALADRLMNTLDGIERPELSQDKLAEYIDLAISCASTALNILRRTDRCLPFQLRAHQHLSDIAELLPEYDPRAAKLSTHRSKFATLRRILQTKDDNEYRAIFGVLPDSAMESI